MDLVVWGHNPWGQQILTHVSFSLFWAAMYAGIAFLVAHASYVMLSAHKNKHDDAQVAALEAARPNLPAQIERHTLMARLFHWVMAAAMFVLLFTAFLPLVGVRFAWVQWHWIAGLVLTASVVYHIIHATVWLDFWSIWVGPKDIPEFKTELLRELGQEVAGPKPGKYPLGNRLYHTVIVLAGFAAILTGVVMMSRVRTPFLPRNPYLFQDVTWGVVYVLHGLAGVGLVGLVIAHVYFAVRPEKLWITKAMIVGWITRRQYLEHHDPNRWVVPATQTPPPPDERRQKIAV